MKKLLVILGVCLLAFAFAGADLFAASGHGLNPYRTPEFVRNPAQMANTVDPLAIAVYNPAGFTKLQDGMYVGLGNIYILKSNEMTNAGGTYKQDEPSPLVPTAAFAMKQGKVAFFTNLEVIDGGGKLKYDTYSSSTTKLEAESSWKQVKVGVSGELTEMVSLTGGVRYIMGDTMAKVTMGAGTVAEGSAKSEKSMEGWAGFFGVNITPMKELTVNVSYFAKAYVVGKEKLTQEGNTTTSATIAGAKGFSDSKADDVIPAYWTIGAAYQVMPELTVSAGLNIVQSKQQSYMGSKEFENQKTAKEYALGADYKANEMLVLSAGWALKKAGGKSDTYDVEAYNPDLDLQVFGAGAKITAMPGLNVNLGVMKAFFKDGKSVDGATTYKRDAWLFSAGVDYKI